MSSFLKWRAGHIVAFLSSHALHNHISLSRLATNTPFSSDCAFVQHIVCRARSVSTYGALWKEWFFSKSFYFFSLLRFWVPMARLLAFSSEMPRLPRLQLRPLAFVGPSPVWVAPVWVAFSLRSSRDLFAACFFLSARSPNSFLFLYLCPGSLWISWTGCRPMVSLVVCSIELRTCTRYVCVLFLSMLFHLKWKSNFICF